jgi:hypothetical protein
MIITIYVMPLFIYPNLSLHSHEVIMTLYDLQIFLYPTNKNVTCVHCNVTPNTETSGALMTFVVVLSRPEASDTKVTSGATSL